MLFALKHMILLKWGLVLTPVGRYVSFLSVMLFTVFEKLACPT